MHRAPRPASLKDAWADTTACPGLALSPMVSGEGQVGAILLFNFRLNSKDASPNRGSRAALCRGCLLPWGDPAQLKLRPWP